jgi:S1-C subfamily serine protease
MKALILAAAFAVAVGGCNTQPETHEAGSVAKIMDEGGHGTAVYTGNNFWVTAAHVVGDLKEMTIKTDDGREIKAEVLWSNTARDVALVRADGAGVAAANLECRTPQIGEIVRMVGNPMSLENITTWGRIAGEVREFGPWISIVPVDGSLGPGMSGGAMFDADGDFVGINVGMAMMQLGMGAAPMGIAATVPGSTICEAMGRRA